MFLIKFLVTGHELFLKTNELSDSDGGGGEGVRTHNYVDRKQTLIH